MLKIEELVFNYLHTFHDFSEELLLTNYFHADWEADLLIVDREGFSHEIEIKLSKSDFKNDFKKSFVNPITGEKFLKHDKICCGDYVCNAFSFLLPMGMIKHDEIPDHCGIIEFYHDADNWETHFYNIREPKRIHEDSYWKLVDKDQFMLKLAQNLVHKKFELKGRTEELIFKSELLIRKK